MVISHENLQEPPVGAESFIMIQTGNIEPNFIVQYQPARGRSVIFDESLEVVGLHFWKGSADDRQKIDLRDLRLEGFGASEGEIIELIEGAEVEVIRSEPRYKNLGFK